MTTAAHAAPVRRRVEVRGVVQGVGFRPFVHGLAHRHGLRGFVRNDGAGVVVEAEGEPGAVEAFVGALVAEAPPLASVEAVASRGVAPRGDAGFAIVASRGGGAVPTRVPPDVATCDACLRELFDPGDRRFGHPFISCTQCGPRFTIVRAVPYDRPATTMAGFPMCAACRSEYEDPGDRRFHAEPIACPDCGPRLSVPVEEAVAALLAGAVVAVKGLGGYHLACDATDAAAVARLRARKARDDKPFAVMATDPQALVDLPPGALALLGGPERPIVIAPRRASAAVAEGVAPRSPWLGVLLPYTPLHHLLLAGAGRPLVMTSGNRTDEPIACDDADARERLGAVADLVVAHDRVVHRRCEDSVLRVAGADVVPVRRSRGHAPRALALPVAAPRPVLAVGAELKATFCLAHGREALLSPHLGDLTSPLAARAFLDDLRLYLDMLGAVPAAIAHDLHPGYRSTAWALEQGLPLVGVQHHHAHAAACLAEHGLGDPALAVVLDGTGYGPDGTLWGGEVLRCDLEGFERVAHLEAVPLPGGEAAVREPWRMAAVYLERAGRPVPFERWPLVRQSLRANAPASSGAGRLFDAIAALLGLRERVTFEGQAAMELEQLAGDTPAAPFPCAVRDGVVRGADLVRAAHDDLAAGRPRAQIAAAFHEGLAAAVAEACARAAEPRTVVLSGGCLQNVRLLAALRRRLAGHGFEVLAHRHVPPNDGGISYGQAAVAARRTAACA